MKRFLFLMAAGLAACSPGDVSQQIILPGANEVNVGFESAVLTVEEGSSIEVVLKFNKQTTKDGFVDISFSSENAVVDEDFSLTPAPANDRVKLEYTAGIEEVSFTLNALSDADPDTESLVFSIAEVSDGLKFDASEELSVSIEDDISSSGGDQLTVVTWNIEFFPLNGTTTINTIRDIIQNMDADVIAFQEINDMSAFASLDAMLTDWEGKVYDVRGSIELGYLYKTSEITSISNLSIIFPNDSDPFPRQPVLTTITHKNGLEVTLIDIHLKCCSEGELRRADASSLLKDYIDQNLASDNVIVLGDYNDDILNGSPFSNFINDPDHYEFTDMAIATGSSSYWSYPSWPSHLDHILISNELFDNWAKTETLRLDLTESGYFSNVSDHRPVAATFENQ